MERDIKDLTNEELQARINQLEHTYAELLADGSDYCTLDEIWKEIQLLQAELITRSN
jgi:hypothetical protein